MSTGILILVSGIVACSSPAAPAARQPNPAAKPAPAAGAREPQLKSIEPDFGPVAGSTDVLISGSNFSTTVTVKFGGVEAALVKVMSDTLVQVTTPPHPSGPVDVVVINPDGGTGTLPSGFIYTTKRIYPIPTTKLTNPPLSPSPTQLINYYTLQVTVLPSSEYGSVIISPPAGPYARDTEVTLTAMPASPNYGFISWGGDALGIKNPVTIVMDRNKSVNAHFLFIGG